MIRPLLPLFLLAAACQGEPAGPESGDPGPGAPADGPELAGPTPAEPRAGGLPATPAEADELDFAALLEEAGMVFDLPEGFVEIGPGTSEVMPWEQAIRHPETGLQARYSIRPLGRVVIDYEDPHSAPPDPEHVFPLVFQRLCERLSRQATGPTSPLTPEDALEFNADWAAASAMVASSRYTEDFENLFALTLHGNGKADAFVVFCYNDEEAAKPVLKRALHALRFAEPPVAEPPAGHGEQPPG